MTSQEYIKVKLEELKRPMGLEKPNDKKQLIEAIFRALMSKKFRKYSVNPEYIDHIKSAIKQNVDKDMPIKFTFVFGGYKLWRLEESPEPDWAELFAMTYYTNWVKPICDVYEPGVWFDFFSDDVIVPRLNNISVSDTESYNKIFHQLLDFMKSFLPNNLSLTLNRVEDQYQDDQSFKIDLEQQIKILQKNLRGNLPKLADAQRATIELNVELKPGQDDDPQWRERIQLVHDAYAQVGGRRPYYRTEDKLMVITHPIPNSIAVGTTKDSVMKFWIGAGVLKPKDDQYRQIILSPSQLENSEFDWQDMDLGIEGKNFKRIRILRSK